MLELKRVLSGKHPSITFDLVEKIFSPASEHFSTEANFSLLDAHGELKSRERRLNYLCFIVLTRSYSFWEPLISAL